MRTKKIWSKDQGIHPPENMEDLATTSEKAQRAHKLTFPAAFEMCEVMPGTEAANKLKAVPLSNDTVRRI